MSPIARSTDPGASSRSAGSPEPERGARSSNFNWVTFIGGLVGMLAIVALIGALVWVFIRTIGTLESDVAVAVIGAAGVVTASVITLTAGRYFERKRQIESDIRLRKVPLYEEFIGFWFRVLYQERLGEPVSEKDLLKFFVHFTTVATVWASDDIIRRWGKLRSGLANRQGSSAAISREVLLEFEDLLLAFRRDTGYPNTGLAPGDLLRLFIDDVENIQRTARS